MTKKVKVNSKKFQIQSLPTWTANKFTICHIKIKLNKWTSIIFIAIVEAICSYAWKMLKQAQEQEQVQDKWKVPIVLTLAIMLASLLVLASKPFSQWIKSSCFCACSCVEAVFTVKLELLCLRLFLFHFLFLRQGCFYNKVRALALVSALLQSCVASENQALVTKLDVKSKLDCQFYKLIWFKLQYLLHLRLLQLFFETLLVFLLLD